MNRPKYVILEIKYGSHLYGTDTPNSDLDIKGVFLPTEEDKKMVKKWKGVLSFSRQKKHGERNTKEDTDITYISFDRFVDLLVEGQTMALDMLFVPEDSIIYKNDELYHLWTILQDSKEKLITKDITSFVGYARKQASRYGIKGSRMDALKEVITVLKDKPLNDKLGLYEKELNLLVEKMKGIVSLEKKPLVEIVEKESEKYLTVCEKMAPFNARVKFALNMYEKAYEGYGERSVKSQLAGGKDFKALSHAIRINEEALELLKTGRITFPRPNAEYLREVKKGNIPYEEISLRIENGLMELKEAEKVSKLSLKVDDKLIKKLKEKAMDEYLKVSLKDLKENMTHLEKLSLNLQMILKSIKDSF